MRGKFKKFLSTLLAAALAISICAVAPIIAAGAGEDPFQVKLQPDGATYTLNQTADPVKATFEYDALAEFGHLDSQTPITVRWYWSYDNSNASRANGFVETTVAYNRKITHTTQHVPATDVVGVKYYYAVITYAESVLIGTAQSQSVPKETVTEPARIEVIDAGRRFEARKTDADGNLLSGAVLELIPDGAYEQDASVVSHEETTADGVAIFAAVSGYYILGEKQAPDGYAASDDKYYIIITANGVYFNTPATTAQVPYTTVTFVNEKLAANPTPTPSRSPSPSPSPSGAPAPSPSATPIPTPAAFITPMPTPTTVPDSFSEQSFEVKKTDGEGNPLSGAVLTLILDGEYAQSITLRSYETTTAGGSAKFAAISGYYILSEKQAPAGYNATDEKYYIHVATYGVFIIDPATKTEKQYTPVTFVNKEIPKLEKDDHFAFMQGYPEGDFRPENNMTRAEAVVMFSRLLSESMDIAADYRNSYYPDVPPAEWYANQVGYMQRLGVLADYSRDGRFRPDEPVTRAEFATLAAHFDNLELADTNNFSDVPADHAAVNYINSAAAKGWITGYPDGTFKPEANITRAEVVTLVGRMLDRFADGAYLSANARSLPRQYFDLEAAHWAYLMIMEASTGHNYTRDAAGATGSGSGERWTAVYK